MSVRAAICLSQVVFVGASSCALKYERLRVVQVYAPELTQHISACGVFNYIPTALHVSFVFVIFQNINNTSILVNYASHSCLTIMPNMRNGMLCTW